MAHVFIVNEQTFKTHLEYQFAGTGASDVSTDFIFDPSIQIHSQNEKRSVGMIADLSRIRQGDKILFFVTKIAKFYGIFEAVSDFFFDPNDDNNYLYDQLGKKLTYRIRIKPCQVYRQGLAEYDALDSLKGIKFPDEICWSLIYRKLGGNRGCTTITDQEYQILSRKLADHNRLIQSTGYTYDKDRQEIVGIANAPEYTKDKIDIRAQLEENLGRKYIQGKAFEHYLQYLTVLTLKGPSYQSILPSSTPITWIGNEVMCSVGERRIDVLCIQEERDQVDISVIELKDEGVTCGIMPQIDFYVRWVSEYISPFYLRQHKNITIHPIIISDGIASAGAVRKNRLREIENQIAAHVCSLSSLPGNISIERTRIIHFQFVNGKVVI